MVSEGSSPFWLRTPEQEDNISSKCGLWISRSITRSSLERQFIGPIPLLRNLNLLDGPRNASWQDAQVICIVKWIHWSGSRTGAPQRVLQTGRISITWELGRMQILTLLQTYKIETLGVGLKNLVFTCSPEDSDAQQSLRTTGLKCEDRHDPGHSTSPQKGKDKPVFPKLYYVE